MGCGCGPIYGSGPRRRGDHPPVCGRQSRRGRLPAAHAGVLRLPCGAGAADAGGAEGGKLLARGRADDAHIEFKCPRCGAYTILRATRPDHAGRGASPMEAPWPQNADHTIRRF
ncbi:Com family DNA-binding transcriptional regulator [Desulfovibrio piger]|uniref:Com family DNA-binding transcriptional regulator n=1 Tax=Desulfovibrio piger TaxID=901 RepID=UPI0039F6185C